MSFKIPEIFSINYGSIDEEHQSLVAHVNTLLVIAENGSPQNFKNEFEALLDELVTHFKHEEALMDKAGYTGLTWHSNHHNESLNALKDLYSSCEGKGKIDTSDVYFCFDQVIKDVAKADLKFGEFLDATNGRKLQ